MPPLFLALACNEALGLLFAGQPIQRLPCQHLVPPWPAVGLAVGDAEGVWLRVVEGLLEPVAVKLAVGEPVGVPV